MPITRASSKTVTPAASAFDANVSRMSYGVAALRAPRGPQTLVPVSSTVEETEGPRDTRGVRAEGRHEGDVTIIPEMRSETDIPLLFLAGCALFVAGRGVVDRNVVLMVVPAAIAAVILGWWIYQRREPPSTLTIGPYEIVYGWSNERVLGVIARDATGWLRIEQNGEHGWFVIARDGDEDVGALMLGFSFDPRDVVDACEAHGWPVWTGQGDAPARPIAARSRVRRAPRKPMSKPLRIVVGTVIVVSLLVCLGALGVPNWYVAIASGIVMFAAIFYSENKW